MYQKTIIVGYCGSNPEQRFTPSGDPVTTFSVATSREYNGEKETTWFRVSVFGKQAESCNQYLEKGSKVLVEGRLSPDKVTGSPKVWTKKDGSCGSSYEMTAENVRFLTSRGESEQVDEAADDIPF